MPEPVPTAPPPIVAEPPDPALASVRALVAATSAPLAVFDAAGECLVANPAFVAHAARHRDSGPANGPASNEVRTAFSPDGARAWKLASVVEAPTAPRAFDFIDVVANALPIMFNAKDTRSRYLFMNRYQAELYGVTPREAVGRTAADLLGADYGSYTGAIDADVLRGGRATPFYEESYAGVDGRVRHWLTSKVPLVAGTTTWGVATVAVDITERKELEARLLQAKDAAEAGSQAKSRFLASMSHELRTPLNAVIGFAEIMKEEALGPLGAPEYNEYATLILRSGLSLLDLITNLLDFARADAGALALSIGDVEVTRLLRSVAAGTRDELATATGKPQANVEVAPYAGMIGIRADEHRLRQLLRALVGNALKFTPPEGQVRIAAQVPPGGGVEVTVVDTGIGMSPEELERVFEPFWQADGRVGRTRDGAGIGLKLARHLALLHGGSLTLDSGTGQGTRAVLTLPHAPP